MLRSILDFHMRITEEGKLLAFMRPLVSAIDTFAYEVNLKTTRGPHIRDAVDLKRWMVLVVFALIPAMLWAIWNSGVQAIAYGSKNPELMHTFEQINSLESYLSFCFSDGRFWSILGQGLYTFIPLLIISYAVGGFWEGLFAYFRRHEISEGFLVTGILFALILPPTIPYWMAASGISIGIILSKELFGGTGMNILNPALVCRCYLFFAYPAYMSGLVWVGTNMPEVKQSLVTMNKDRGPWDSFSQATFRTTLNSGSEIPRIHVDAIGEQFGIRTDLHADLINRLKKWNPSAKLGQMDSNTLLSFMTAPKNEGGLGMPADNYQGTIELAKARYSQGKFAISNLFFGNMLGSVGETSTFAIILGALFLIITQIASWRTMLATLLGAYGTATLFQLGATFGVEHGAWNPAIFAMPAYLHLISGGLAFGLVFMTTDPVSSPDLKTSHWIYGILIGFVTIVIRNINPAFPEGIMLAILFGNVFGPLIDHYVLKQMRRARRVRAQKALQ